VGVGWNGRQAACGFFNLSRNDTPKQSPQRSPVRCKTYLVVELPDPLLPEPEVLPLELPEPMPLLEPELGDDGVVLGVVLVPPLAAPEPDLLKWASHSERETWPSLFLSTDEKLGALLEPDMPLEPPAAEPLLEDGVLDEPLADGVLDEPLADGVLDEPLADGVLDEPLELEPDAAGDELELDLSLLVLLDDELCARAALDSANNAAAVAALSTFRFNTGKSSFG
jgi:hypothetical protein